MSPRGGGGGSNRPTPGASYRVTDEGSIEQIAAQAYGDPNAAAAIWGASGKKPGTVLHKGTTLIIPGEPPPLKLTGKSPDDMTIMVAGREIPAQSTRIIRTMDTAADGWTCRIAWMPGADPNVDEATHPFRYPRAAAYIGNTLLVNGCLYTVSPEMTDRGLIQELQGFSFTADAIDSHVQPPYESNNVSLKQIATELVKPLGIKAIWDKSLGPAESGAKFARACAHESDTIFSYLAKLAAARGILVSSTPSGDMLFLRANEDSKPVGTVTENEPLAQGWKATYDGRKRFYAYHCWTSGSGKQGAIQKWGEAPVGKQRGPSVITAFDTDVPRSRFLSFRADDTTPGSIQDAARWRKNKQIVDALTLPFPVSSWYAPNGELWRENTLVTVVSPTLRVPKGYTFLIRSVEYVQENNKRHAMLHIVPPQAYSAKVKEIGDIWT